MTEKQFLQLPNGVIVNIANVAYIEQVGGRSGQTILNVRMGDSISRFPLYGDVGAKVYQFFRDRALRVDGGD